MSTHPPEDRAYKPTKPQGSGFNIHTIPKFKNPQPATHRNSARMKNMPTKADSPVTQPLPTHDKSLPQQGTTKKRHATGKLQSIRKHRHWNTVRFAAISFVVFLLIFNFQIIYSQILYLIPKGDTTSQTPSTSPDPVDTSTQSSTDAETVGAENLIIIPKIGVSAPLVFPDTIEENAVLRALQNGVVHYSGTANPGENGNAVFFGHSSNDIWEAGNYKFVFVLLEKLAVGDQYEIHYESRKYVYVVEETKVVAPTDLTVLNPTTTPYSTLITCTPPGTSWRRFIVKAKQVSPTPNVSQVVAAPATPATQPSVLPSAAPTLLEQLQAIWSNLINAILGREASPAQPGPNTTLPPNRLPEVFNTTTLPTTF